MPNSTAFPHLRWTFEGPFEATFSGGRVPNAEVAAAKADPKQHAGRLRGDLESMRKSDEQNREKRKLAGLPEIRGKGFLLRVLEGTNVDALAYALGIELVAETEHGLMFAASENLTLEKLETILDAFEIGSLGEGGSNAPNILDVFFLPDDRRKLAELLSPSVLGLWPFVDETIYTFDLGIQTAPSTRDFEWTRMPHKKKTQSPEEHAKIRIDLREKDRIRADEAWASSADQRMDQLAEILTSYGGTILGGYNSEQPTEGRKGIVFPDSVQSRVSMSGRGFRDLVGNFPHLFEVAFPEDIRFLPGSPEAEGTDGELEIQAPSNAAASVCVIDSGIQEGHRWLAPAIDAATSRCFLPDHKPDDVADYVWPRGHGTRVAGAVLYPQTVPKTGVAEPVAWIQNARVIDKKNQLPNTLPPECYLTDVVSHFNGGSRKTKLFNHSISDSKPCQSQRMCKWAAKLDDLSHRFDVLFIQCAGNLSSQEFEDALVGGATPPEHLLDGNALVASPGQSLHALTVGSVAHSVFREKDWQSAARNIGEPSAFSRTGYAPPWSAVKPEVVEFGGDRLHQIPPTRTSRTNAEIAPELLASTLHGQPAISADDVGTSFATPKVAHLAAHLQNLFPNASPQLYRALIVHSARWPAWTANGANPDEVLRMIGYGIPSLEYATENAEGRVTLITPDAVEIASKQFHLYHIPIPDEIRSAALEGRIRIDVTLAYTASPRRTRSRRTGYLETWLDWRAIHDGEPLDHFRERMQGRKKRIFPGLKWTVHQQTSYGDIEETSRDKGTVQKDWAIVEANEMPQNFAIAVRAHVGWNHKEGVGLARYCLAVSFETLDLELPIYSSIETAIIEIQQESEVRNSL